MKAACLGASVLTLILASGTAGAAPTESDPSLCKRAGTSMICTAFDNAGHWDAMANSGAAISVKEVQVVLTPNGYNHTKATLTFRSKSLTTPHGSAMLQVNIYRAHLQMAEIDGNLAAADTCSDFADGAKVEKTFFGNYFSLAGVPTEIIVSTTPVPGANGTKCP